MAEDCCNTTIIVANERYRRVLWIALGINAVMFVVEIAGGFISGSVSLLADAIDFLGDSANYGLSLAVFSLGMMWRARSALLKGLCMGGYGVFVMARAGWAALYGEPPEPFIMGAVAVVALFANLGVAAMLFAYRQGDSDMRSVWLCSRNDAINNIAVIIAAIIVFGTASKWPDLAVAAVMGTLGLTSSAAVIRHALGDMRSVRA
ncbi:MAG: cation transporter [Burkholderiales bacterium]